MRITESRIRQIIRQEARRALGEARRLDPSRDPEPDFDKLDRAGRQEHTRYLGDVEDNEPGDIETIAQQIIDEVGEQQAKLFYNEIAAGSSWPPNPKMARELASLINRFSGVPGLGDDHLNQMAVLRAVSNIIRGPAHRRRYE